MSQLDKYTDEELFRILDSNVEEEIRSRGYENSWHKKIQYAGVIYILVNPAFQNLVKIGYADDVNKRLKSLNSNAALPDPFHVYATYRVKKRLEDLKLHELIDSLDSNLRHSRNREFYEMTPEKAYTILSVIAQINGDEELLKLNPLSDDYFTKSKDIVADEKVNLSRKKAKPRLTFELLSIPVGTELTYADDNNIKAITTDLQSSVRFDGKVYTLSALVALLKGGGSWQGGHFFMYEGKRLTTLRKEVEEQSDGQSEVTK